MFFILLLIVAVAAFNIVSTLVMVVTDKQRDVAILRTLGFSARSVMAVFVVQGTLIGLIGTTIGAVVGVITACECGNPCSIPRKSISYRVFPIQYLRYFRLSCRDAVARCWPNHLRFIYLEFSRHDLPRMAGFESTTRGGIAL